MKISFMKDEVDQREVDRKYCPKEQMWLDVLTKPVQGQHFRSIRAKVMNCWTDYN